MRSIMPFEVTLIRLFFDYRERGCTVRPLLRADVWQFDGGGGRSSPIGTIMKDEILRHESIETDDKGRFLML